MYIPSSVNIGLDIHVILRLRLCSLNNMRGRSVGITYGGIYELRVEIASRDMIYIPSFITVEVSRSWWGTYTYRQQGDLMSLLKIRKLRKNYTLWSYGFGVIKQGKKTRQNCFCVYFPSGIWFCKF
jgi:hypothetical protein